MKLDYESPLPFNVNEEVIIKSSNTILKCLEDNIRFVIGTILSERQKKVLSKLNLIYVKYKDKPIDEIVLRPDEYEALYDSNYELKGIDNIVQRVCIKLDEYIINRFSILNREEYDFIDVLKHKYFLENEDD